jgi:hypothetical protein
MGTEGPSIDPASIFFKFLIIFLTSGLFLLIPLGHSFYYFFLFLFKLSNGAQLISFMSYLPEMLIEGFSFYEFDYYEENIIIKPFNRSRIYAISKRNMRLKKYDLAIEGFNSILAVQSNTDYKNTKKFITYCTQESNYQVGLKFFEDKNYHDAYVYLSKRFLYNYKDSSKIIASINLEVEKITELIIKSFEAREFDQVLKYIKKNKKLLVLIQSMNFNGKRYDLNKIEKESIEITNQYQMGLDLFDAGSYKQASTHFENCITHKVQNKEFTQLGFKDSVNLLNQCKDFIKVEEPKNKKLENGRYYYEKGEFEIAYRHLLDVKDFKDAPKYLIEIERIFEINKEVDAAIQLQNYELAKATIINSNYFNSIYFEKKLNLIRAKILESKGVLFKQLIKCLTHFASDSKLISRSKEAINIQQYPEALIFLSQTYFINYSLTIRNQVMNELIGQLNRKYLEQDFDFILASERRLYFKFERNKDSITLNNYLLNKVNSYNINKSVSMNAKPVKFNDIEGKLLNGELYLSDGSNRHWKYANYLKVVRPILGPRLIELFELSHTKCRLYDLAITDFIENDYESFLILSQAILNYKDVPLLRVEAENRITAYKSAVFLLHNHDYDGALSKFINLGEYRDSSKLKNEIEKMINNYVKIETDFNNGNYLEVFQMLNHDYSFSQLSEETNFSFDIFQYKNTKEIIIKVENHLRSIMTSSLESQNYDEVINLLKSANLLISNDNEVQDDEEKNIDLFLFSRRLRTRFSREEGGLRSIGNINNTDNSNSQSSKFQNYSIKPRLQKNFPSIYELAMKVIAYIDQYNYGQELIDKGLFKDAILNFQSIIGYKDSLEKSSWCKEMLQFDEYLKFFFKEFCGILQEEISFISFEERYQLAIVKDKVERITGKDASGKLMERTWRNIVFLKLKKEDVREFSSKDFANSALNVFDELKSKHGYLFVRSYVYIILVIENEPGLISKADYHLFYFNTNYRFGPVNGKSQIFNNVEYSFVVKDIVSELKTMKDKNMDSLDCARAYNGQLPLYEATIEKINSLYEKIEKQEVNRLLIEGPARSGKTIIAMQLLHKFPHATFLLMNYYFYLALRDAFAVLGLPFPSSRIFHHDLSSKREFGCAIKKGDRSNGWKKTFNLNLDFVIVDEAQRLSNLDSQTGYTGIVFPGFKELDILAKDSKISVFLGDNYQRINPKYDEGFDKIRSILKQSDKNFINYRFNETVGIPINLVNSFKFILDPQSQNIDSLGTHQVRLFNDASAFISDFKANPTYSKHYVTLPDYSLSSSMNGHGITIYPVELRYSDYPFFLNSETLNRYVHSTYEVISRELQSLYLIIPDSIRYIEGQGIFDAASKLNQEYLFNHLYVNMTRATQKLVIFTSNQSLFNYLNLRLAKVSEHQLRDEWKTFKVEEQKLNFVTNFSEKIMAPDLKSILINYGFTGFIHATELTNLIKILTTGYLYSRDSGHDTFKDIADQNIIYKTSNFVKSNIRFYFAPRTPTLYHFAKITPQLVILEFDYSLVENFECYFTDGNAASNYSMITGNIKEAIDFDWKMIFSRGPFNDKDRNEIIRSRNAEFLVNANIPIRNFIKSITFKEQEDLDTIANQFPEFKLLCKIEKNWF